MKLLKRYWPFLVILVIALGMGLRFYRINDVQAFGWDQARDAWLTRDIIQGKMVLNGPRTGVGHFHLGPLWYYLLVPFYLMTGMDPVAANYLNILLNLANFMAIYLVTKKIFDDQAALFVTFFYAIDRYLIEFTRVSGNPSPIPGVAAVIFYCIYKVVYKNESKFVFPLAFLTGMFFHLHFSAVFLPLIILGSFALVKDRLKVFVNGLMSLPLFLVWFIPEVLYEIQSKSTNVNLFSNFMKDYFINGFHLKFFLYRLYDGFIQFETMLSLPKISRYLVLAVPATYLALVAFDRNRKNRIMAYLTMLWFLVPAFGYSFYAGTTSEYYMLMTSMLVIYVIYYFFKKAFSFKSKLPAVVLSACFLVFVYFQVQPVVTRRIEGGLNKQKREARERIKTNSKIRYNEGDIKAYLWQVWVEDKKNEIHK
ncbi:MAG: ArnT family glycosyltransferase [Patescibacteria group bacterium]